ncbi:MAG TPA: hypothetical protein DD412_00305 [Holosporales bacterium]|nr:hypothetical protein [Holosporales bacterium]
MTSSILPFDPLMDITSLTSQTGLFPVKVEAGTEMGNETGKDFQDSLFAFEEATPASLQIKEESSSLLSLLKFQAPPSEKKSTPETSQEVLPSEKGKSLSSSPSILNTLIAPPLQKEALAIKEEVVSTPLENAEAILDDEVSMIALSYAMALQEKENHSSKQSQLLGGQTNEVDFPALSSALSTPPDSVPTTEPKIIPLTQLSQESTQHVEAEINADTKETILPLTVKTTPSAAKQGTLQEIKTKDSLGANSSTTTGKEVSSVAVQSQAHSEGNLREGDRDSSQEEGEELNSENTKGSSSSKDRKSSGSPLNPLSFSETLSKAPSSSSGSSSAQAGLTSLQSGALESIEGKDVEEAFHRGSASIDTKTTAAQSTQPASSQSALTQNASLQEQVAFSIKNNAAKGKSEINLQLRPDSLGRLNIKIDINKEGQTFVVVTAERTETRDLLQKDSQQLMELLEKSDLEISDDNMSYSLFNDQERKDFEEQRADSSEIATGQEKESAVGEKSTTPLISLGMSEIQVPRHGGTWQAIA